MPTRSSAARQISDAERTSWNEKREVHSRDSESSKDKDSLAIPGLKENESAKRGEKGQSDVAKLKADLQCVGVRVKRPLLLRIYTLREAGIQIAEGPYPPPGRL